MKKIDDKDALVCPRFHQAVELVGRRWTGAILFVLIKGDARFGELKERIPELSDRLLSERLKELEEAGIVDRDVASERPICVTYRLTERGRALKPVIASIGRWAEEWL